MREWSEALAFKRAVRSTPSFGCSWHWLVWLVAFAISISAASGVRAQQAPVRADVSASTANGYGRLVFVFGEEVKPEAQVANGILVIHFKKPVEVSLDQIEQKLPGYVQSARRDPDGNAVRFSLARKVTANVMEAGERLYVDLLPDGWAGLPPGLPQEVVDDLARRARDAERKMKTKPVNAPEAPAAPVKLRMSSAPNFSRFAFDLPVPMSVEQQRDGQELRVRFGAPVKVDLGEAKSKLPNGVLNLDVEFDSAETSVVLVLAPTASSREFREGNSFLVDVTPPPMGRMLKTLEQLSAESERKAKEREAAAQPSAPAIAEPAAPQVTVVPSAPVSVPSASVVVAVPESRQPAMETASAPETPEEGILIPAVARQSNRFSISFPFSEPVSGAVFRRGDMLWIVFDTNRAIDAEPIKDDPTRSVAGAEFTRTETGGVVRVRLSRARLPSVEREGNTWIVTLGDGVSSPSQPLPLRRATSEERAAVLIPLEKPGQMHRMRDPDIGDEVIAVTAEPPVRGILRGQNFVEFRALASIHGVAIVPLADDFEVVLSGEGVTLKRPMGLVVSEMPNAPPPPKRIVKRNETPIHEEIWKAEREADFTARESELARAVAMSPPGQKVDARIMLARFYLANGFAAEAKGTLDAGSRDDNQIVNHSLYYLLHGMAELDIGRPETALREFGNQLLTNSATAAILKTIANSRLARFPQARDTLRAGLSAFNDIPLGYQHQVLMAALRASVEVRDFVEASRLLHELESYDTPHGVKPTLGVLTGRVAEGVGHFERALGLYTAIADMDQGAASAEARFRSIAMKLARGELDRPKAIDRLEMLAFSWRGDRVENEVQRLLGQLYVAEARYREGFRTLDAALLADAGSDITESFQLEMASVFEDLYLTGKAETLPAIEALALYYDFSKLTPIGRRGDELIRRLVDRLVSVDLLDQAAELLDHQVQYRLSGAAKAQVAVRLAIIHLMNRKPAEAVRVMIATRMPELPQDVREQRLLIEARALSDSGRHDTALELLANLQGLEVDRLRSDISWAAKDWRAAGERIEKILGERWKNIDALDEGERHDVLRAALAYALGDETIALRRLHEKFMPRMPEKAPERAVLAVLSGPEGASAKTLAQAAKALSGFDSLGTFLRVYKARYPERPLPPDPMPTSAVTKKKTASR